MEISRRDFIKGGAAGLLGAISTGALTSGVAVAETQATIPAGSSSSALSASDMTSGNAAAVSASASSQSLGQTTSDDFMTYGSILNPQDTSYTDATTDYSAVFSPLSIGSVTLQNRIVKSCAGSETQKDFDWPSDTSLAYYEQFAKGGVGMICFEPSNVIPASATSSDSSGSAVGSMAASAAGSSAGSTAGSTSASAADSSAGSAAASVSAAIPGAAGASVAATHVMYSLDISTDDGIAAHKAVADDIHQYGTPIIAQMYDMRMAMGASSTRVDAMALEPSFANGHMQTTEEVNEEQGYFIDAAERYYKAGFDGVELNCSCNHYFSTYLSRFANRERTDQYSGQSIENRARIVTEIIQGIRERVGDDFIIQVLYSGVEDNIGDLGDNEYCTGVAEACEFAKLFEAAGASCLHIRSEAYGHHCGGFMPDVLHYPEDGYTGYDSVIDYSQHFNGYVQGQTDGACALIEVAAKIKSCVTIPVGTVGDMDPRLAPDLINNAIRDGKIDYAIMNRPLMADPELANKLKDGRRDEVAPCTHCMTCFVAPFDFGTPMYCRVNPALTRAFGEDMPEGYDPVPVESEKKVMVIGGGPAGMEAARIAAQRGCAVSLYEKEDVLGGLLDLTAALKDGHEKIADYKAYLSRQLEVQGVEVKTGVEVTADLVKNESPDAVVVAIGGSPATPDIDGVDGGNVIAMGDFLSQVRKGKELQVGKNVVIIGAQFQACDLAIYLLKRGKKVVMLNQGAESEYNMGAPTWPRTMGRSWIRQRGAKLYHEVAISGIDEDGVTFDTNFGTTLTVPCDTVIIAEPFVKNRELSDSLAEVCDEVYAVGDCYSPGTIADATARANIMARRIGTGYVEQASQATGSGTAFTATASGKGDVTVTITVDNGSITSAVVDTSNETEGVGRGLGDQFSQEIMDEGTIDAVAGATLTSNAVLKALDDCLSQAGLK